MFVNDSVRNRGFLLPFLSALVTGFIAIVATFAVIGGVSHHLIVWPVCGILLGVTLPNASTRCAGRLSRGLAAGVGVLAGGLVSGLPLLLAVLIAAHTVVDLTIAASILCPSIRSFGDLNKRENVLRLVLASLLSPLVTALLGGIPLAGFLKIPPPLMAAMIFFADAAGIGLFLPTGLLLTTGRSAHMQETSGKRLVQRLLPYLFFTVVCCATFWQNSGPYLFLMFPPLMVLLLTAGLEGAVFASVLVTITGAYATVHGHGPLCLARTGSPDVRLLMLQVFIWVTIVTALPVGAAIDERKKAELSATHSRSVQQAILSHTLEAIILSSLDGKERYASEAIERLTGFTPNEYISLDRMATVHPDDRARAKEVMENIRRGKRETGFRYRIRHKDGSWNWVESSVSVYGENEVVGYVVTIRDIARLIETELGWSKDRVVFSEEQQRLEEAQHAAQYQIKLRDDFLSHVSHELRSPLTSIYSFTAIMADGLAGAVTSEQNEYLGIVLKNVTQLQSMIEDLLTVTQSREGKLNIQLQACSLTEAIEDSLNTARGAASRKQIELSAEVFNGNGLIYADPTRVRQILIILLDNAIKFTPVKGTVKVSVSLMQPGFLITKVIDTGCGIPNEKLNRVFEKLYQVEGPNPRDTSSAGRTGLGLGLHIAKSLVVRQSGNIWVTSVPDEGSTFHFTLPLYSRQDEPEPSPAETLQAIGASP